PFVRPDLATLVSGLNWIRDPKNNYPIRGMHK
ncbi:MAG: thioredoxin peroxidase, partial [Pseudomonadota bacterium]|nr:thioredoxin peroxidase [Pseudomonadota bacterium]